MHFSLQYCNLLSEFARSLPKLNSKAPEVGALLDYAAAIFLPYLAVSLNLVLQQGHGLGLFLLPVVLSCPSFPPGYLLDNKKEILAL